MKFLRYEREDKTYLGIIPQGYEEIIPVENIPLISNYSDMVELIRFLDDDNFLKLKGIVETNSYTTVAMSQVKLLSPIKRPPHDIIAVGVNYRDHREECMDTTATVDSPIPVFFSKRASYIYGSGQVLPPVYSYDRYLDYEVELAVIIGKEGKDITTDKALDYVFGYSVFNDLSCRKFQKSHQQWFKGKSLDGLSAMGPYIIHKSALSHPLNLNISTKVNGQTRQSSNTSLFITGVEEIISDFSRGLTIETGDIFITGTPGGVAWAMKPPVYLKSGDIVECTIENIGTLSNTIE